MNNKDKKTKLLVLTALMTALVFICTLLFRIPVDADCYIHLGDAVMLLAVFLLPRGYACFAGPVGAALADMTSGLAFWMPWTLCIKLLYVLIFGFFLDLSRKTKEERTILGVPVLEFVGFVLAGIVAVLGYFVTERILFGNWIPAATCIPFNLIQVTVAAVIAELLHKRVKL